MTHVDLALWSMYANFPYDIPNHGGWQSEITGGDCAATGTVKPGGSSLANGSVFQGDWNTARNNLQWLEQRTGADPPFFIYQGFNIVHPPYATNEFWFSKIDSSKIDVPACKPGHTC